MEQNKRPKYIAFKQLAFFFKCKQSLSHSLWFGDCSVLRQKTGLRFSDQKIWDYINYLISVGLVTPRERNGRTEYKFKKQRKYKIDFNKEIEPQLMKWYLRKKKSQFDFMADLNKKVHTDSSKVYDRNFKSKFRKNKRRLNRSYFCPNFNMSYKSISEELLISITYAKKIIDKLVNAKLISRTVNKVVVYSGLDARERYKHLYQDKQGYYLRGFKILRSSPCFYGIG